MCVNCYAFSCTNSVIALQRIGTAWASRSYVWNPIEIRMQLRIFLVTENTSLEMVMTLYLVRAISLKSIAMQCSGRRIQMKYPPDGSTKEHSLGSLSRSIWHTNFMRSLYAVR